MSDGGVGKGAQPRQQQQAAAEKFIDGAKFFKDLQDDPASLGLFVAVVVGILSLLLLFLWSRKRANRRTIVLTGICESGKTALFAQLVHGKDVETYTSTKENAGFFTAPGKSTLRVVDIPGHERVRGKHLDGLKPSIRAIVYVVDASTVQKQLRDTTEYFFNIISDPAIHASKVPVLVACNKQDLSLAKGSNVVRRELEKEIHLLRETHARSLQGQDNAVVEHAFLGKEGQPFSFDDLSCKIEFCETSAIQDDERGIRDLQQWLQKVA